MIGSHLPDYVLPEAEDRARRRYLTPSNVSPWHGGVSSCEYLTVDQCDELRRRGIDPAKTEWVQGKNWMWVVVPVETPVEFDRRAFGRAVQHIACPIVSRSGDRFEVLTPRGRSRPVYAGGALSAPARPKRAGGARA